MQVYVIKRKNKYVCSRDASGYTSNIDGADIFYEMVDAKDEYSPSIEQFIVTVELTIKEIT